MRQVSKKRFNRTTNNSFAADKFGAIPSAQTSLANPLQNLKVN